MLTSVSQRLIQFKRIAVLTDLGSGSEKMVDYAASLARWYGSELLLVHAYPPEFYAGIPPESLPVWPASGLSPKQDAEQKIKALTDKLNLQDLRTKVMIHETRTHLINISASNGCRLSSRFEATDTLDSSG
jgi:nucleotide-binding universal stress UspA family protein